MKIERILLLMRVDTVDENRMFWPSVDFDFNRENRKIPDTTPNPKLEFPKATNNQPISVNKFGNEVIQKKS